MDELEKIVRGKEKKFDIHEFDKERMWSSIDKSLTKKYTKKRNLFSYKKIISVAAGLLILCIVFIGGGLLNTNDNRIATAPEVLEIDSHYKQILNYQILKVKNSTDIPEIDKKEFLSFMDDLELEHKTLINELNDNIDNDLIIEAIITNYRKRIEFLEDILKRINTRKKYNNENDIQI